jgi:hypothetical protein
MWDLWWTKWHWGRFFPEYFGFPLPLLFHCCSITWKNEKTNHLHHRVAQEALRLWCVRSICCGALHHHNKKKPLKFSFYFEDGGTTYNAKYTSSYPKAH